MKVVHRRNPKITGMTSRYVKRIARTFFDTNINSMLVLTREDPFLYLKLLQGQYGLKVVASPVTMDRKLIGYKFKNVS